MKSRQTKQNDLNALTKSLESATSAMLVSFTGVTVAKDQEFRNSIREAGASYQVVKNTLARIAVKGTDYEQATEHLKGVTAIAWTDGDPVVLSKAISKFMKENADHYSFKTGVVDGKLVDLKQVGQIASLPSKEELISKLLYIINAQAQRIVTVINAVPRDLAVVIKQIGEKAPESAPAAAAPAAEPEAAPEPTVEAAPAEGGDETEKGSPVNDAEEAEKAEEAQEKKEDEQDPSSAEGEQAEEAEEGDKAE